MTHARTAILTIALCACAMALHAQQDPEYRMEIGGGVGLTGYLGDFNGSLTSCLQPGASIVGRYIFNPWMALRLNAGYGKLKGSSSDTDTWYPDYDNRHYSTAGYSFSHTLYDMAVTYEYNFWPYGTGWDYRGAKRLTPYIFGGIGVAVVNTPVKNHAAMTLPIGLGMKLKLGERLNLGLEWAMNFTTNDWLDEAGDPYMIESKGMFKNTDCFSRLQVTLTYSFAAKCINCNKE